MSTVPLPDQPSLDQLRRQVRELLKAVRSGEPDAVAIVAEHVPGATRHDPTRHDATPDDVTPDDANPDDATRRGLTPDENFPLHLAQLALARRYGFASWHRLTEHVEVRQHYSRRPGRPPADEPLEQFLSLAVLLYTEGDRPARWQAARDILHTHPELTKISIHAAAAAADHRSIAHLLEVDERLADQQGGPLRWEPLLYLTNSRLDPDVPIGDVLAAAGLLLQHGADPNAGYLWYGQPTAFTALTGVFGKGEEGPENQPPHPHQQALARLLLEAGADPNDGQTLYNRMFHPANDHLELLFDYGLGEGDGGPWHARLPDHTDDPADLLRAQLAWAVTHGMTERIALLVAHGVDVGAPLNSRRRQLRSVHLPMVTRHTPLQVATLAGRRETVAQLRSLGATADDDPTFMLVGALLDGDAAEVATLAAQRPGLLEQVRTEFPSLILRAAVADRPDAVKVLVENGFDIDARGRQDIVVEQEWETALHHAAGEGKLEMARLLLDLGADPTVTDRRFHSTPLGWAQYLGQPALVELLSNPG